VQLLLWLGDSGKKAYMLSSTAPSSFDSRVYLVAPYAGGPADWDRLERDLKTRLEREYQPGRDDYSLGETLAGTDALGVNDPDAGAHAGLAVVSYAKLRKAHERRFRILAPYIIGLLRDENLKTMIRDFHPTNGYEVFLAL
jgi:hypothetical protein